jgi:hypothetical protein
VTEVGELDPQDVGDWWAREHWLKYAQVQSCDGFGYQRDEAPDGGYRYVWLEAYVDGDMLQHYLLDVHTKVAGDQWEQRQYVAVSTMSTDARQPGPRTRVALHDQVTGFTDATVQHQLRFADSMRWFADFVQQSAEEVYGSSKSQDGRIAAHRGVISLEGDGEFGPIRDSIPVRPRGGRGVISNDMATWPERTQAGRSAMYVSRPSEDSPLGLEVGLLVWEWADRMYVTLNDASFNVYWYDSLEDVEAAGWEPSAKRTMDDPVDVWDASNRVRQERAAMDRARRYAAVDPFYHGKPITDREEALMRLALRSYTYPGDTDEMIVRLSERTLEETR